jgi:hypothetical protein
MEKIQTLVKFSEAIRILMPLVETPKNHTSFEKTASGLTLLPPLKDPLWKIDKEALTQTMNYIFLLSHQCFVLSVVEGKPSMFKIIPELHENYKQKLSLAVKGLSKNPHITDKQRSKIEKMNPLRIMQCVVKDKLNTDIEDNQYLNLFRTLSLPDGMFIMNLTDAVIVRKDKKHPFPMVMGDIPAPKYSSLLPILSMSGQKGYMDIPIPNYDELINVYAQPLPYDTWTTEWNKKTDVRAVFRGGPTGCGYTDETNMRIKLALLAKEDLFKDRLDIGITVNDAKKMTIDTGSVRFDPVHGLGMLNTGIKPGTFLTMAQQSNYRYILHVDGNVNAYRLLTSMTTGSLVLRVTSDYTSWAERYLEAGVHYLAVERDLSNLDTLLTYCEKNQDKCKEIAENGRALARKMLTKEFIENYFLMMFNQFRLTREEYESIQPKVELLTLPSEDTRVSSARVAMIVPHRNNLEQLEKLRTLQSYGLGKHLLDIYVLDQNNVDTLKRPLLWNVGYLLSKEKRYDRYLFHAVDALPDETMFKQYFKHIDKAVSFGPGVMGLTGEQFEKINGFPNTFMVGEEEALVQRLSIQKIPFYAVSEGILLKGDVKEVTRWDELAEDMKRYAMNGIEQLKGLSIYVKPYEYDNFITTYLVDKKNPEKEERIVLKDYINQRSLDEEFALYPYKVTYVSERNQIVPLRKVKEPVPESEPLEPVLKESIKDDHLYVSNLVVETVSVKFEHCGRDMEKYFMLYARDHLEGRCIKEGYVRPETTKVITYTSGGIHGTLIEFRVLFLVQVCHPYEGMRLKCIVESVSKIGIRAVIRKGNNPIVVYMTRELNPLIYMEDYELEQIVEVSVLGHRFEMRDPFISVLGFLLK